MKEGEQRHRGREGGRERDRERDCGPSVCLGLAPQDSNAGSARRDREKGERERDLPHQSSSHKHNGPLIRLFGHTHSSLIVVSPFILFGFFTERACVRTGRAYGTRTPPKPQQTAPALPIMQSSRLGLCGSPSLCVSLPLSVSLALSLSPSHIRSRLQHQCPN